MKKLILINLLFTQILFAQTTHLNFGEISKEEIEMTEYEKDLNAKAVILYDKGRTKFVDRDGGYNIEHTRHKRVKIFDKSETSQTEVTIPYYVDGRGKTEKVKSIEAITYNFENGKLKQRKLDVKTSVFSEKIGQNWYQQKFIFPDVQDGSVLEFKYVLESPFHFNLTDWKFQDVVPTIYSEYKVSMIPFYEYIYLVQGISKFSYQNSQISDETRTFGRVTKSLGQNVGSGFEFQDYDHTYVLEDVPAFVDESYITSVNDYILKMDFQLSKFYHPSGGSKEVISTWEKLNSELINNFHFGDYIKKSAKIAKKLYANELSFAGKDKAAIAKEIVEYVKANFEWNGINRKYTDQSAKDFYKNKTGNSAEINLFMIGMLQEADIAAYPVILSTRSHGKIAYDYPFDHFTNYVIALVNIDPIFLADGSDDQLGFNKLPTKCFNGKGLIVQESDSPRWVNLTNSSLSLSNNVISMELGSENLNLLSHVTIQNTEYQSDFLRRRFKDNSTKLKEYYTEMTGDVSDISTRGYSNTSPSYVIDFDSKSQIEQIGDLLLVQPFLKIPMSRNLLTQEQRHYPIDFVYPWEDAFVTKLKIPSNYSLQAIPESFHLDDALVQINLSYSVQGEELYVRGNYRFKKSTYTPDEYPKIKNYMDLIVQKFNTPVVFEKAE